MTISSSAVGYVKTLYSSYVRPRTTGAAQRIGFFRGINFGTSMIRSASASSYNDKIHKTLDYACGRCNVAWRHLDQGATPSCWYCGKDDRLEYKLWTPGKISNADH